MQINEKSLKENRMHGDASFPLNAYHMDIAPGAVVLDCHWHEELEFLIVTSGKATFQIGAIYFEVHAGEGIFVNSGELHAGYALDDSPCSYEAVVFSTSFLHNGPLDLIYSRYIEPIVQNRLIFDRHLTCKITWQGELLQRLETTARCVLDKTPAYELRAKSELFGVLMLLAANGIREKGRVSGTAADLRMEKLKTALKYMQENYSQKLSTQDISALLAISEGHFCRIFRQYFKKTPMEYLNYYRITQAVRLLEETEHKILEIAMETGFDNLSYFIGTFRHFMGMTPSKYRKQAAYNK
ncbi:MAG TPA: AraC family transcriptional regulator [Clostridia bacterium]|nr:AraC family transcriptional regulator [Clostridia bacterium]